MQGWAIAILPINYTAPPNFLQKFPLPMRRLPPSNTWYLVWDLDWVSRFSGVHRPTNRTNVEFGLANGPMQLKLQIARCIT